MWSDVVRRSRSGLAYRRAGTGPAVLLLHGIPGSADSWRAVARRLPGDLDVIVPDLLGFGRSARPASLDALHAAGQAVALDALCDELRVTHATVVGHDFGGPVALALLARRPSRVRSLALLATNTFTDTPVPFPLSAVTWPVVGVWAARLLFSRPALALMLRQGAGRPRPRLPLAEHIGDRDQQRAIGTIFRGSLTRLVELYGPIEAQLRSVDVPVLVAWGDRDPFFPLRQGERTAQAAHAGLRVYAGAGHFLPEERSPEVAEDVEALARMSTPARGAAALHRQTAVGSSAPGSVSRECRRPAEHGRTGAADAERVTGIEPAWPAWKAWDIKHHLRWSAPSQAYAVPSACLSVS